MKRWNNEQLQAIEARNTNVLVSASAGSGKTGVLVQRLSDRVLIDRIPLTSILAMTFTEDAASEMKKRLAKEINDKKKNAQNREEELFYQQQLSSLSNAFISTIHSFCYSILKNYYYVLDLSLNRVNHLLDPAMEGSLQGEALDIVLDEQCRNCDEAFFKLNDSLTYRPADLEPMKDLILKVAELAQSQADPQIWLDKVIQYYEVSSIDELPETFKNLFNNYLETRISTYKEYFVKLNEHYLETYGDNAKGYEKFKYKFDMIHANLENCITYTEIRNAFRACARIPFPNSPDTSDKKLKNLKEVLTKIEDEILKMEDEPSFIRSLNECLPLVKKVIECVRSYLDTYEQLKAKHEVIDFSDMEHFAIEILRKNNGEIANVYRNTFEEIMVDEFQDSNDVQDELVRLICRKNNVFRVGDVKQSIYGFRHALPSIMQGYKQLNDENNQLIIFNKNYRSSETLVRFNNVLYNILMNVQGYNTLPFKEEDIVSIGSDRQTLTKEPIIFHALHPDMKSYKDEKIRKENYKARYIAYLVSEMKRSGKYDFKDMAVLVRGNARLKELKKVFEEYQIPYYMNSKSGFYSSRAIQITLSCLKVISDPRDDLSFIALASSELIGLSNNELAQLKINKQNECYFDACIRLYPEKTLWLTQFKQLSKLRIGQCLTEIFKQNHFYDHLTTQDKTNLDQFYSIAIDYENQISTSIEGFLNQIEAMSTEDTAEASFIGKEDNVVRFMTIHNSKGLEFPVVFVFSSETFSKMEDKDFVLCDSKFGLGFNCLDEKTRWVRPTLIRKVIEYKKNQQELEEEIRILYVATTRAVHEMHFVDFVDPKLDLDSPIDTLKIDARNGYTSWVLQSLCMTHDPSLFRVYPVIAMPEIKKFDLPSKDYKTVSAYQSEETYQFVSPSKISHQQIQPLNFDMVHYTSYGTSFHTMIEHLPNTSITEQMIRDTAHKLKINCTQRLIKDCLSLYEDSIFKDTLSYKVYHEYPFQIQIDQSIVHGFMDYVAVGDKVVLIDFKTDHQDDESYFYTSYQSQIIAYKEALRILYPDKEIVAYIYSTHMHKMLIIN